MKKRNQLHVFPLTQNEKNVANPRLFERTRLIEASESNIANFLDDVVYEWAHTHCW